MLAIRRRQPDLDMRYRGDANYSTMVINRHTNMIESKIKVLLVDDHCVVRSGLRLMLSNENDIAVTGEAENAADAIRMVRGQDFDLVMLDISMPGKNILELIKLIKLDKPKKPILILSMYPEEQYAIRMLRAGADGYLGKESAPEKLISVIRQLSQGEKYISCALAKQMVNELNVQDSNRKHTTLTDREFQVFIALAKGKRLSDIAAEMALSIKTISTYRTRLLKKMGLFSNGEIIHYAVKNQLLDQPVALQEEE